MKEYSLKIIGVLVLIVLLTVQPVGTAQTVKTVGTVQKVQPVQKVQNVQEVETVETNKTNKTVGTNKTNKTNKTIRAVIVTGQNSHDWKTSSRVLKQILEDTGLFDVDLAVSPPEGNPMEGFVPDFTAHDVVILDYNGDSWSQRTQKAFVKFIRAGGGVVVYHNSGNAFRDWPEYSKIIGLGGGGRDESAGPYIFWKDGEIIQDESCGIAGYHGYKHDFLVQTRDSAHPVTSGLPPRWEHAEDELYSLMRGSAENLRVLATAYSDPVQKGSGRHEPVLFTNQYGKGRVFHTTLGHVTGQSPSPALECVGFIVTFQRGVEWAATGRVTQRIPGDFPAVRRESPTPSDVRRWTGYRPPVLEEILEALKAYEYGQDEKILSRLRDFVLSHKDSSESSASCEEQLVSFLESDASLAAKMAVCRHLRQVGTKRSVPVLEEMLVQKDTSDHARYALEKIPGPEAERALLRSLSKCSRGEKIGIISSLGQRKARAAVPELSRLLNESDEAVADASAKALGQIASPSAAKTLTLSLKKVQGDLLYQMATSLLRCAEVYLNQENLTEAAGLYAKMTGSRFPVSVRQAALKGQIASDKDNSRTIILDTLDGPEQNMHIAAIGKIRESIQDSDIQSILDRFSSLPEMSQVAVLEVLSRYPRQAVLPSVAEATKSSSQLVRTAALEALKTLGDVSVVPLLAKHAAQSKGRERQAARDCLWNLKGPDIDLSIILNLIKISEPSVKRELIRSIGERRIKDGKHVLFDLVFSPDSLTRMYALRSLGRVSEPSDMPLLLDLLLGLEKDPEKVEMRKVIAAAAARIPHRNRKADEVREKLADVEDAQRRSELYRVLGFFGDNSVLPLLRQALLKEDSPVYDGAVRALADWPDSTPKDDLLLVAQTAGEVNHRVLALRAYIQMTGSDRFRLPSAVVQSLQKGLELAERPDEKKKILALLPQFICAEAVKMAQSLLTDKTVHAEAKAALHKILYTYLTNRYHVFR